MKFLGIAALFLGWSGIVACDATRAAESPPFISSLQPTSGPVGTVVTVSGKGFTPTAGFRGSSGGGDYGGNTIRLGSNVTLKNLNSVDGVTVKFEIPKNMAPGVYSATIVNSNGTSNSVKLTVTENLR